MVIVLKTMIGQIPRYTFFPFELFTGADKK